MIEDARRSQEHRVHKLEMSQYSRHGVSTVLLASEKPIVRSPAPQRFSQELLKRISHRDRTLLRGRASQNQRRRRLSLASQYSWSTTSGEAAAEGCLPTPKYPVPVTTLERHADPVTRRGKYLGSTEPSLWQQFAREWDMLQARCPMKPMTKPGIKLLVISPVAIYFSVVMRPKISQEFPNKFQAAETCQPSSNEHNIMEKARTCEPCEGCEEKPAADCKCLPPMFTRPMPGFGGFVPHYPVHPEPSHQDMYEDQSVSSPCMCGTTGRIYRGFPKEEYRELTFNHKGPLSKTVTLTYPFNPFNKVV